MDAPVKAREQLPRVVVGLGGWGGVGEVLGAVWGVGDGRRLCGDEVEEFEVVGPGVLAEEFVGVLLVDGAAFHDPYRSS
jgi:hypothetical protein